MRPLLAVLIVLLLVSVAPAQVLVYQSPVTTETVVAQEWSAPMVTYAAPAYSYRPRVYRSSWPAPAYFGRPAYAYAMADGSVMMAPRPGLVTQLWRGLFGQ